MIIGATLAFLTTILILDGVTRAETRTVNGWSSIRKVRQPQNGLLVRAALQKALPVVNVFEEAAYPDRRAASVHPLHGSGVRRQ